MTKNSEMKWSETKGNKNLSIKPLSSSSDIRNPVWGSDRGSEFHKIRWGLDRVWNYTC